MSDQKPSDWFGRGRSAASALIREKVQNYDNEHGSNDHGQEYRAAIEMARAHATIWTPATEGAA